MTRRDLIAGGAMLIIVTALAIWSGTGPRDLAGDVQGAVDGVGWKPGYPAGHEHLARAEDIGTVLWGPHPLYCDPDGPGRFRDPMIAQGWAWIAAPPSEAVI